MTHKVDTTVNGKFEIPSEEVGEELVPIMTDYFGGWWSVWDWEPWKFTLSFESIDAHDMKRAQWFLEGWLYARGLSARQKEGVS